RAAFAGLDPLRVGDQLRQPAGDLAPRLASVRVDYAPPRMAALEAELELALLIGVKADTAPQQLLHRGWCTLGQNGDRRGSAETAAGSDRVGRMLLGGV